MNNGEKEMKVERSFKKRKRREKRNRMIANRLTRKIQT